MYGTHYLARLAEAHACLGQIEEGRRFLDKAVELMDGTMEHVWEAEIYRLQGQLALLEAGISRPRDVTAPTRSPGTSAASRLQGIRAGARRSERPSL